jgi:hypothetical protein
MEIVDEPISRKKANYKKLILGSLLVAAILLLSYCGGIIPRLSGTAADARPRSLTIFYTCDTSGQMEPCRCSSGQTGGMSRRLGWLKSQKPGPSLLVDAGDITAGASDWELFEFEYILKGYAAAGYDTVNVGHRELSLGRDRLRALRSGKVPFVSANVFDDQGKLIFEPYRIVKLKGGGRAAIIGIADIDYDPATLGPNLRVGPPVEALARWLPELRGKADLIVLLAFATETSIRTLAEKFESIDVIVGGKTFRPTGEPLRFNKSLVVLVTDKGKGIGHLQLEPGEENERWKAHNEIVVLTQDLPSDQGYTQVYEDYKRNLVKKEFLPTSGANAQTSHSLPRASSADQYAGASPCRECHAKAYEIWSKSAHARAFASLQKQNNHFNPRCLPCHTVGYGATDGYVNPKLTPVLNDVQCESCHGRGEYHIRQRKGEKIPASRAGLRKPDCVICHNEERSPGFDFETKWKLIDHRE